MLLPTPREALEPTGLPTIFLPVQKVVDVRFPRGPALGAAGRDLVNYLRAHRFSDGDKIPIDISVVGRSDAGLEMELSGASFGSTGLKAILPAPLEKVSGMGVVDYFRFVPGVSVRNGGNPQNMAVDIGLCISAAARLPGFGAPARLQVAAASSPLDDLRSAVACEVAEHVWFFPTPIQDRLAVLLRLDPESPRTLVLSTRPTRIWAPLVAQLPQQPELEQAIATAKVFVTGEPVVELFDQPPPGRPVFVVNPATAWRQEAAAAAVGRDIVLTMNAAEARAACAIFVEKASKSIAVPRNFAAFLGAPVVDGRLSSWALDELDRSVAFLISLRGPGRVSARTVYACPVTFGRDGGLLVSIAPANSAIGCWTSIPSAAGLARLRHEFADPELCADPTEASDVGAGDASAAVTAFVNAVDPVKLVAPHLRSARPEKLRIAALVFASALSRLASGLVLCTAETFMPIVPERLAALMDGLARQVADATENVEPPRRGPATARIEPWGIDVVVWRVGAPANVQGLIVR